jgi:integrase/recombinase XerD
MLVGTELILSFGQFLKKIGKKESTIQSYCRDVSPFLNYLTQHNVPLACVTFQTLAHYKTNIHAKNSSRKSNSFRRAIIAIRQFYRFLPEFSHLRLHSLDQIPIPKREELKPRKLSKFDVESLLYACNKGSELKNLRDKAIIALFCFEGLKVSELIQLEWKHFLSYQNSGSLLVPGDKKRLLLLNPKSLELLINYKTYISEHSVNLVKPFKMFLGFKGKDTIVILPKVSRHGLKFMIYELGETCHLPNLNTENLRHFAIQFHLDNGSSPEEVMRHLGLKRIGNIAKHYKIKKNERKQ